jgi:hypothetical protein
LRIGRYTDSLPAYHIHEKPVPADGNCTGTGAHLDPYKRGETPPCDASKPETCQTGDLAGKHGKITSRDFSTKYATSPFFTAWLERLLTRTRYTDLYLATLPESASYFGHLSVVFHFANKTRISCANFTLNSPGAPSSGYALPTGTGSPSGNYNMTVPTPLTPRPATETATAPGNGTAPTPLTPIPVNSTMSAPNGTTTTATGTVMPPTAAPSTTESAPPPPENSNAAQKLAAGAGALALAVAAVVF